MPSGEALNYRFAFYVVLLSWRPRRRVKTDTSWCKASVARFNVLAVAAHAAWIARFIAKNNTREPSEALEEDASHENVVFVFFWKSSTVSYINWKVGLIRGRCASQWRETVVRRSLLIVNWYGVVVLSAFTKRGTVVGETKINYSFALWRRGVSKV